MFYILFFREHTFQSCSSIDEVLDELSYIPREDWDEFEIVNVSDEFIRQSPKEFLEDYGYEDDLPFN